MFLEQQISMISEDHVTLKTRIMAVEIQLTQQQITQIYYKIHLKYFKT